MQACSLATTVIGYIFMGAAKYLTPMDLRIICLTATLKHVNWGIIYPKSRTQTTHPTSILTDQSMLHFDNSQNVKTKHPKYK